MKNKMGEGVNMERTRVQVTKRKSVDGKKKRLIGGINEPAVIKINIKIPKTNCM